MPFVKRNSVGGIVAVSQIESEEFTEVLDSGSEQLRSFLVEVCKDQAHMSETDLDFVRVVEDLVELLVSKNYISFTDLPPKAQEKFRSRKTLRGKMNSSLDLLSDDEDNGFF
ncbi:MAG: hypothetical protein ACI9Y1_001820 [Lentisphaeria bacterium]|jgi:hypothetical protein